MIKITTPTVPFSLLRDFLCLTQSNILISFEICLHNRGRKNPETAYICECRSVGHRDSILSTIYTKYLLSGQTFLKMNKIVFLLLVVCLCQSIDAFCASRYVESYTCPAPSCQRGCEPCLSPCAKSYPCDKECECLKALMHFPEVEYPMPMFEYRPYCCGCTR